MKQHLDFTGKIILVTGSTRGIGRTIAESFAEQGARVIINGRTQESVQKTVNALHAKGYKAKGIAADISEKDAAGQIVSEIERMFGRLDVLINNAAMREWNYIEDISDESWELVFQANFLGIFRLTKKTIPLLKKGLNPSIVNISSIAAQKPLFSPTGVHYIASKGALLSLTRGLAKEFRESGIRVNAVVPGLVNKENDNNFFKKHFTIANEAFLKKLSTSHDVSNTCLFLASDMAVSITGESIIVGGY